MEVRGIKVEPVRHQAFRSHRDFPGTIELNHRKVANLTTLVRGRAIEVRADLGQEVKRGTLLATRVENSGMPNRPISKRRHYS